MWCINLVVFFCSWQNWTHFSSNTSLCFLRATPSAGVGSCSSGSSRLQQSGTWFHAVSCFDAAFFCLGSQKPAGESADEVRSCACWLFRQYYAYLTDTQCKRVGTQCWVFGWGRTPFTLKHYFNFRSSHFVLSSSGQSPSWRPWLVLSLDRTCSRKLRSFMWSSGFCVWWDQTGFIFLLE